MGTWAFQAGIVNVVSHPRHCMWIVERVKTINRHLKFVQRMHGKRGEEVEMVRRHLLSADYGGTDSRRELNAPFRMRAWPRASTPSEMWLWSISLSTKWSCRLHINVQELKADHLSLR